EDLRDPEHEHGAPGAGDQVVKRTQAICHREAARATRASPSSGTRRATHENARSIAPVHLLIDELENEHAAVEGDDLPILRAGGLSRRTDIVPTALTALEAKLLQLSRIGKIHHDAAGRALADDERLLALSFGIGLGPGTILGLVIGGISPASDNFGGAHARRNFGGGKRDRRCRLLRRTRATRKRGGRQSDGNNRPSERPRSHRLPSPYSCPQCRERVTKPADRPIHLYQSHG